MDHFATPQPNLILEKLRSDHQKMEQLTNSFLVGLEDLGRENAKLSRQLAKKDDKIALMSDEMDVHHLASMEAQEKFDGALRVNNELRAELQGFKDLNAQLQQHNDEARGSVIKLSMHLEAAQYEINRLNFQIQEARYEINGLKMQVKELYHVPTDAALDHSKLWPTFAGTPIDGNALPTPPLATQGVSEQPQTPKLSHAVKVRSTDSENNRPTLVSTPSNGTAFNDTPGLSRSKATAEPSPNHLDAAILKPKANGITRGGSRVDESFARINNHLALTDNTSGSDPVPAPYAPSDPRVSTSLCDIQRPQTTLIQDVKRTLSPECVPYVPSAAKSKPVSKLNPFSQEFVPAISRLERPVTPPHKRVQKVYPKSEDLNFPNVPIERVTMLNNTSQPASSEAESSTAQRHDLVHASTSTDIKPETTAVDSSSKPQISSTKLSKTDDPSSRVTDNATAAKNVKVVPPHLRGLPRKAAAPKVLPVATIATPSAPVTVDVPLTDTSVPHTEPETTKVWLDTIEKQSMGQSSQDERSDSTPTSFGDNLIDLDVEDAGQSSNIDSAPGFALDTMQDLLNKAKAASPTATPELQTFESLLATFPTRPAEAQNGSNLTAILQGLLAQYQATQNVPAKGKDSQTAFEDEGYSTAASADPYLMHVNREATDTHTAKMKQEQSNAEAPTSQIVIPKLSEAGTTGTSDDDLGDTEEVENRVSDFKAQLPATKNESNITAEFLTAYDLRLHGVKSKYGKSAKSEKRFGSKGLQAGEPARYLKDQYLDPDYVAPKIVGTRNLGEFLDSSTKFMMMNETPNSRGQNMKIDLEWEPVVKDGRTIFTLRRVATKASRFGAR